MKRLLLLPVAVALCGCGGGAAPEGASKKIAIAGARLEPGGGKPVIPYSMVIVENGKFKAVGEQADVPLPKDAEVVNGLGQTITPVADGVPIEAGLPANLILKGANQSRTMREGQWQR
jgi:hypothetical protein